MESPNMNSTRVDLQTSDGVMDCYVFTPSGQGRWPAIVFYFDAFGVRRDASDMATRLAEYGYVVAMPNLFYRTGPFAPFAAATAFKDPGERERLNALVRSIDNAKVMRDTQSVLEFLSRLASVRGEKVGCVGYCLGGQFALSAAGTFPDRVAAAASIHGVALATNRPDSPHLLLDRARAQIYIAVAETDAEFPPSEAALLKSALAAAGTPHEIEIYPGTRHGFAVNGRLVYDAVAADRHWQKLARLFGDTLA
jgi:carboxymethylenebutenolidase